MPLLLSNLTLKIPVLDDNTLLFKFDVVYFLSSQSLMIKYTLPPSYSNDVLTSFRLHPVASVRSLRYVIHPYFVAYACSIILTSTPRRNCAYVEWVTKITEQRLDLHATKKLRIHRMGCHTSQRHVVVNNFMFSVSRVLAPGQKMVSLCLND